MSITSSETVRCHCDALSSVEVVHSLNAGRHPHLREHVLARTLHVFDCAACGESFCVSTRLFYFDFDRRQLIGVFLPEDRQHERGCNQQVLDIFNERMRNGAPDLIRQRADTFLVRACFGYEELREKLVIDEAGLSDLTVEITKALILASPDVRARNIATFRLDRVTDTQLHFIPEWLDGHATSEVAVYDRAVYDCVHDDADVLYRKYPGIASGAHVSLLRLLPVAAA